MKVLVADDNAISRRMLEAFLTKWGYEVVVVSRGDEAWEILQSDDAPPLAVLDWVMPGRDGLSVCRGVRQRKDRAYVYVLLLTARGRKEDVLEGLEAGADDYVTKPFDPYELRARLRTGRRIVELQEQLLHAREVLRDKASRDPLTNLWNHATILAILRKELTRALRTNASLAVAMIDVDRFKTINDTYGHPAGDAILIETSHRLQGVLREYDFLGRYGGDEFLAVIPGCNPAAAAHFAESFRGRIDFKPVAVAENLIPMSLSVGIVALADVSKCSPDSLVRLADGALYRAKTAGRDCVAIASDEEIEKELAKPAAATVSEYHEIMPGDPLADLPELHLSV